MVKHTQTICQQQPNNGLSVFDHFMALALKVLIISWDLLFYYQNDQGNRPTFIKVVLLSLLSALDRHFPTGKGQNRQPLTVVGY